MIAMSAAEEGRDANVAKGCAWVARPHATAAASTEPARRDRARGVLPGGEGRAVLELVTHPVFNPAARFLIELVMELVDSSGTTSVIKKFFLCHHHSGRV